MPDCSGLACGDCRLLFLLQAGHGCGQHPAFPAPSSLRGRRTMHRSGMNVPRERKVMTAIATGPSFETRPKGLAARSWPLQTSYHSSWPGLSRPSTSCWAVASKTWMPGPSPRRRGFGPAGGTSPGMTISGGVSECSRRRAIVAVGDAAIGSVGELAAGMAIEAPAIGLRMAVELLQLLLGLGDLLGEALGLALGLFPLALALGLRLGALLLALLLAGAGFAADRLQVGLEVIGAVIVVDLLARLDVLDGADENLALARPDVAFRVRLAGMVDVAGDVLADRAVDGPAVGELEQIFVLDLVVFFLLRIQKRPEIADDPGAFLDRFGGEKAEPGFGTADTVRFAWGKFRHDILMNGRTVEGRAPSRTFQRRCQSFCCAHANLPQFVWLETHAPWFPGASSQRHTRNCHCDNRAGLERQRYGPVTTNRRIDSEALEEPPNGKIKPVPALGGTYG